MQTVDTQNTDKLGTLQNANLDQANYLLAKGYAGKAEAEAYVEMWNRPGMRGTTATLKDRLVSIHGIGFIAYYIDIH